MNQEIKAARRGILSKRAACTALAFAISMAVGWYAGVDLTQRGGPQAFVLIEAILVAIMVWMCSIWPKDTRDEQ